MAHVSGILEEEGPFISVILGMILFGKFGRRLWSFLLFKFKTKNYAVCWLECLFLLVWSK